jgi:hypothetical protein
MKNNDPIEYAMNLKSTCPKCNKIKDINLLACGECLRYHALRNEIAREFYTKNTMTPARCFSLADEFVEELKKQDDMFYKGEENE